ncbi:CSMD [Mytilus edulis]|uniref:CSMD n=1 Tax=Mytilus edulis TaxID=6550 RepID=A0A8S3TLT6_MYTED|nr:CSMD [Mytilus edulis]
MSRSTKKSTSHFVTPTILTGYHINDTVKFVCDIRYALSGPDTLICILNDGHTGGKWNNSQPICQDIKCSRISLNLTENEVINTRAEMFSFGEVVNISCKQGYLEEFKLTKCVNMNKWNNNRTVCREKHLNIDLKKSTIYKETSFESTVSEEAAVKGDLKKIPRQNDRSVILSVNNDNTYYNKVEVDEHYSNEEDGEGYYSFTLDKQIPRSAVLMKEFYDYVENGREVGGKLEMEFAVSTLLNSIKFQM